MLHVVLDCRHPETLADFWALALGYRIARVEGAFVVLLPQEKGEPALILQRVPEDKIGKNRMHMDIEVDDVEASAAALVGHGARRLSERPVEELGVRWITLADPEGNEFDLTMSAEAH
jgi:predicted enzyme related to lactoylglutathione lyase